MAGDPPEGRVSCADRRNDPVLWVLVQRQHRLDDTERVMDLRVEVLENLMHQQVGSMPDVEDLRYRRLFEARAAPR